MSDKLKPAFIVFADRRGVFHPGSDLLLYTHYAHEALCAISLLETLVPGQLRFALHLHDGVTSRRILTVESGRWRVVGSSRHMATGLVPMEAR